MTDGSDKGDRRGGGLILALACLFFLSIGLVVSVWYKAGADSTQERQQDCRTRLLNLEGEVREHDRTIRRMEGELRRVPIPLPDP